MLSNKAFDILKWICMVFLGAFGLLYQGLSRVWGLPLGEEVCETCYLLQTFLGACLGISTIRYKQQQIVFDEETLDASNMFENFDEEEFEE